MSATCGRSTRRHVAEAPHLAFAGLQAYHGSAQHLRGWDERPAYWKLIPGSDSLSVRERRTLTEPV